MTLSAAGLAELSGLRCETPWIILTELSHAQLAQPIRLTEDGVSTVHQGNVYTPYQLSISLPDNIEGQIPQAQIVIDNTSQEIIAELRGLPSSLIVTFKVIRTANLDYIEEIYEGMQLMNVTHNIGGIRGSLTDDGFLSQQCPYVRMDERFPGLFP